jgi:SAM-dependent methyltransferase
MTEERSPAMPALRRRLRRYRTARSLAAFGRASTRALNDPRQNSAAALDCWYRTGIDPWGYSSKPDERHRYELALAMINDSSRGDSPRALEVGCSEGMFTAQVAPRCASLLAVDISKVALDRARARCADCDKVEFREWDVRTDPGLGRFELVLCMDVICDIHRPLAQRRALAKVAGSVAPGGRLVVSAVVQDPVIENARWAKWLGRGGFWVIDRFGSKGNLSCRKTQRTENHVIALFEADLG